MDSSAFTVMSICSGVGGLDLGLRLAVPSARTVCMVEREAFAVATLVAKMEEGHLDPCPIWTDLARFDGKAWRGTVDCIVGGYPCQPFSFAGARKGEEDPRHLWPHVARIVGEVQPTVVFFENVSGHLSLGFEQVAEELQELGYVVTAGLFTAAEVGAPHRRQRLFIYGYRAMADSRRILGQVSAAAAPDRKNGEASSCTSGGPSVENAIGIGWRRRRDGDAEGSRREVQTTGSRRGGNERMADAKHEGPSLSRSDSQSEGKKFELSHKGGKGAMADADGARLEERRRQRGDANEERASAVGDRALFPPGPTDFEAWKRAEPKTQPAICGMADGDSIRVDRLRALGNGVVPLVAAVAFRTLAEDSSAT